MPAQTMGDPKFWDMARPRCRQGAILKGAEPT